MDAPVIGRDSPTENEQRALGGFFVEGPYSGEEIDLVQVEMPVGCQRVADAFDETIDIDRPISSVLTEQSYSGQPEGFPDATELARRFGSRMASYTAKVDAVIITTDVVWVTEVKTRNQRINGMHDAYEGFGQVLMNRDRFEEDYPTIAHEREVKSLLLAEDSEIDVEFLMNSLEQRAVSFFDPTRGGFLVKA
jgi:hypothetical protein